MSCDPCTVDIQNLVATQIPQIRLLINRNLATSTPWTNILQGGTFEANQGYSRRAVVPNYGGIEGQNRAVPTFTDMTQAAACSPTVGVVKYGSTEFTTQLGRFRGQSNSICVKDQFGNVKGAMEQSVYSMQEYIKELIAMDIRYQLLVRSGVKAVVNSATVAASGFDATVNGGFNQVGVAFPSLLPDSRLTTAYLRALRGKAFTELNVTPYGTGSDTYAMVIGGDEAVRAFQNDEGDRQDYRALVTGNYVTGLKGLTAFQFIETGFRGIAYGMDQFPLRFNTVNENGFPEFISHRVPASVASDFGDTFPINPEWQNALYEVCFMVYKNSFRRLVPPTDLAGAPGDGRIKFTPQANMGELQWHHVIDNAANAFGDYGYFKFQISRAFEPVQPHAIIPILFKRCPEDLGLVTCADLSTGSV